MYLVKTPFWLPILYPSLTWHKSREEKCVYLTFDDGPIPFVTPFVLNTLNDFNAKATFFCIGDNVQKHPEIYSQVLANGHAVGNHTQNHPKGWDTPDTLYIENIHQCSELVKSNLFRPPYGRATRSQYSILNTQYSIIMWDVLSGDFDTKRSPEKCFNDVVRHTKNGSIIVFHDSLKAMPRLEFVLPRILETLTAKGYQFKSL